MISTTSKVWALLALAAVLTALAILVPVREMSVDLIDRIRGFGAIAPVVYCLVFFVASMIGLSRGVLVIIAGVLFEPVVAVIVVFLSLCAAFIGTFLIARYFAADWITARLEKIPQAKALMGAVEQHGFRLLILMRMNPFVPGFINGYGFGLTSIRFLPYFAASVLGSVPLNLAYIYLGWVGGKAILTGDADAQALETGTLMFGVAASALMLVTMAWYGRRYIRKICN